ncbi:MAG TPA: carboxylesterase family protein [Streptosporangiaceae bacterium]|nr:carboxylesterase family protein [Streptosporangiaceae bacterium]
MPSEVNTTRGTVRGHECDGVLGFLGIPYAASPTGALRFQAPVPPPPWDGVLDASAFSATPPKPDYAPPFDVLLPEPNIPGDDWLTLNVWTPGGTGLPVMVWLHGGAFSNGNSAVGVYDGHAFARDGVVLVSVNYRLGVDGFAYLPGAPANRGLLDQIAALEWVRDNIGAFGGDPGNVTVFGESAGAMSITTLLAIPRARGLFGKAITQSGAAQAVAAPADAALVTGELGRALGLEATAENLARVGLPALIEAQAAVRDALTAQPDPARFGPTVVASSMPFIPVIDGDLIPGHPMAAIAAGAGADVPLITGTTTEEYRLFLAPTGMAALITDDLLATLLPVLGISPAVAGRYRANRPGASPGDLLAALLTDLFFRRPALAIAEARIGGPAPTYVYEFAWQSPADGLGACHSLELPFVFDNLSADGTAPVLGTDPPGRLAAEMHAAWIGFARAGDPGWRPFDRAYPVRVFRADGGGVETDPRGDERRIWSAAP